MGILAGKAKKEFTYKLGILTGQMNRRHALFVELEALPEPTTDTEEGVQQVLVDDEWFDYLLAKWNEFGDLAEAELAGVDGLFRLLADEPRLMVQKELVDALQQQRHQCGQAIVICAAVTSNMEAAKAGMTLEDFMEWRATQQP